jgi:hypothetical protein
MDLSVKTNKKEFKQPFHECLSVLHIVVFARNNAPKLLNMSLKMNHMQLSLINVVYYCPRCKLSGNNDGPSLLSYNYTGYHYDDSSWGSKIDWYMKNAVNGPYLLTVRGYVHQCDKCGFYLNNRDGLLWPNNLGEKLETEYTHEWKNK